jgi:hypothetical protein
MGSVIRLVSSIWRYLIKSAELMGDISRRDGTGQHPPRPVPQRSALTSAKLLGDLRGGRATLGLGGFEASFFRPQCACGLPSVAS